MIRLNNEQINAKKQYINNYINADNAADGSAMDPNANVTSKNIATLSGELYKDFSIQLNRSILFDRIAKLYDIELANEFIRQIETHELYVNDETSLFPYCASINMFPLLTEGMQSLGGESKPPKHLRSFCGSFINMCFAVSSQLAGAIGTVEFLMYFDHFARKDHGDNYLETHEDTIKACFENIVYSNNQPAAARNYQSIFWNISIYDENYFNSLFEHFMFPDGDTPKWETLDKLQVYFMKWFNEERTKALLTFPVVTAAMLTDGEKPTDTNFARMCAKELSEGNSFFIYQSESADSLSSCCRLRNEFTDNSFSMSNGVGGVATGSCKVMTPNFNRIIQDGRDIKTEIEKTVKYLHAYRTIIQDNIDAGIMPIYDAGFINLSKQFVTVGISGLVEASQSQGLTPSNNEEYKVFIENVLIEINEVIKRKSKELGFLINTEFIPGESLNVKNYKWDKKDGYEVPDTREVYTSYFYAPEDENVNEIDKFILHGKRFSSLVSGGSAYHSNLDEYLTEEGFYKLLCVSAKTGCNFFGFNVKVTCCEECGYIDKNTLHHCSKCGSKNISHATRIIGYLKKIKSFSTDRKKEESMRFYHKIK